jgi:drug/metabolite transporter (DMT)-like permease
MWKFWIGNLYLLVAVLCASGGHIMLKALLNELGTFGFDWSSLQAMCSLGRALRLLAALAMVIAGFLFWIMSLSRLNISYAYPIASSSVLLVTFFSVLFLNEAVSARMWWGTALIVIGTILVAPLR